MCNWRQPGDAAIKCRLLGGTLAPSCEGERATDALVGRSIMALGTATGASGTPSDDGLRALAGPDVALWPDADEPGRAHMQRIATRLALLGVAVRWYDPAPDATDGRDAADCTLTEDALRAALATAPAWRATSPRVESTHGGSESGRQERRRSPSQATELVELAAALELYRSPDGEAYADVRVAEHRETHALRSHAMRAWLARIYHTTHGRVPSADAVREALGVLAPDLRCSRLPDGTTRPAADKEISQREPAGRSPRCIELGVTLPPLRRDVAASPIGSGRPPAALPTGTCASGDTRGLTTPAARGSDAAHPHSDARTTASQPPACSGGAEAACSSLLVACHRGRRTPQRRGIDTRGACAAP